jgi:hypothetical protein
VEVIPKTDHLSLLLGIIITVTTASEEVATA